MATSRCLRFLCFPDFKSLGNSLFFVEYEDVTPLQYRHVAFHFYIYKTVYGKLVPNSVLHKQKETTGSADAQCCSVLNLNLWPFFGKPVINWQHYLQIQILARKNTSWQTEVFNVFILSLKRWNKGYITGMFSFASYFCWAFLKYLPPISLSF